MATGDVARSDMELTRPERAFLANPDRCERGASPFQLPGMEESGVRLRPLARPTSGGTRQDNGDSPTTTTSSGTRTPGSGEDLSQSEGNMLCTEDKRGVCGAC
jgi:hypothetical protein